MNQRSRFPLATRFSSRSRAFASVALALLAGSFIHAQAQLVITEIQSSQAASGVNDYWELTNLGAGSVDLSNYKWNDSARNTSAPAVTIPPRTIIAANESIIFTALTPTAFRNWWGAPTNAVQIISAGSAPTLGSNDAISLFDSSGTEVAYLSYAGSGFLKSDGANTGGGHAGASAGGAATVAMVLDPSYATPPRRYAAASVGNFGAFASAANAGDIGSPGVTGLGAGPSITLTVSAAPASFAENATNPAGVGAVSRAVSTPDPLVVNLASSDITEATVPATVTILANEASANFDVTAVNDSFPDGSKTAIITASAAGATAGTFNVTVTDDGDVITSNLMLTEILSQQSNVNSAGSVNDFWELTNFGASVVDISGHSWHDEGRSASAAAAYSLPPGSTINPGESVIFTAVSPSVFRTWWGLSSWVKVFQTAGPGLGQDDGVSFFDNTGNELFYFNYDAGGFTRADGSPSTGTHAGPSAGGAADTVSMIWVPTSDTTVTTGTNGPNAPRYTFATGSNFGSFTAVTSADIASPGRSDVAGAGSQSVGISGGSIPEGNAATTTLNFTVTRGDTATEFTVDYAVTGGTASSGTDYAPVTAGTLNFTNGGAASQNISVTANGDTTVENHESVTITLSNLSNTVGATTLSTLAASGTITNDDVLPVTYPPSSTVNSAVKGFINLAVQGGVEISAFDPISKRLFVTSDIGLHVVDLTNPATPVFVSTITPATLGVPGATNNVTSAAVRKGAGANPSVVALCTISSPKTAPGYVLFLNAATGTLLGSATVGANPDHLTFTPDGTKVLVANEGELNGSAAVISADPTLGTVSIIDVSGGFASPSVATADFTSYDSQVAALKAAGVRIFDGGIPSTDFEPEYLAVSPDGTKALVTLQEANAVATLDIATATFTSVVTLGKKDFSTIRTDVSDQDGLSNPILGNPVFGLYMPDSVTSYSVGGQTYYITANEGDDRNDFVDPNETTTVSNAGYDLDNAVFPTEATLKLPANLGRLVVSNPTGIRGDTDNDGDIDEILSYGGRSFSILDSNGALVFDSGDMVEMIVASQFPANFDDGRSDAKGPEPEGVTVATFGGRTFAFVGLERSHMVLMFDVTNPLAPTFTTGLVRPGDLNPEGLVWIPAAESPSGKPLLVVSSEDSDTISIHELTLPTVSIANATVNEGDVGTTTLNLPVTRNNTASTFSVDYAVTGGSATAGTDYVTLAAGTLNFTSGGGASQNISITVNGDTTLEAAENITVTLSNVIDLTGPTTIATAVGTGTIRNDDAPTAPYASTSPIINLANTGTWPAGGVTVNGTQFINLGLQGVGRVPASSIDPVTGENIGSISDMQITGWTKNLDGTYSGKFNFLPDRGYNSGAIFSNYAARINEFDFTFTPYTSPAPTILQNQVVMTFTGSTRFTYDHDNNSGTAGIFSTGLLANSTATLFGGPVPSVSGNTTQSDGTFANRMTIDSEGLILDKRPGKSGSGWMSDEYGPYIYHFNSAKQIDGQLQLPEALIPHKPVGTTSFVDTNVNGRRTNQGMEGIAQSPSGSKLFALLQSATLQDSGPTNQSRFNTRLLVYNVAATDTPNDPVAQYVIQLPRVTSAADGGPVDRTAAQSAIIALNDHQLLILSRDGNGRGATGTPMFKSILLAELNGSTNIDGTYDAEAAGPSPAGALSPTVTPLTWTEALNLLGKLGDPSVEIAKFGLNLNTAPGDINSISEKWEGISMVSANDPAFPFDYFLFVGNDNDFISATGQYRDASGALQPYNAGLENDTVVLAYRVRMVAPPTLMADTLAINTNNSPLNLVAATGVSPLGGTFSGPGIMGDTFDPALAPLGVSTIAYTLGSQSVTFNVTVTASPTIAATPSNALIPILKSSLVLTTTGTTSGQGGSEIPAFDPASKRAFAASDFGVQAADLTNPSAPVKLAPIDPIASGLSSRNVSHVIVKNGVLAVSIIASPNNTLPGTVAFFNPATGSLLGSVTVGAGPDQLTFTPDGTKVLVANEGEKQLFSANPASTDPDGSVSIIDVSAGFASPTVTTATFNNFNGQEAAMRARGIRVFPGNSASTDLEPEYIAVAPDGLTAMITLQEANAVATLDIATATITAINPLGLKNFAPLLVDFSDRDSGSANIQSVKLITGMPAYGMFMPDGISSYQSAGQTYYVTANEGDDRNDFSAAGETTTVNNAAYDLDNTVFPTEGVATVAGPPVTSGTGLKGNAQLGRLAVSNVTGLRGDLDNDGDIDRILSYGGRSFSILDASGKRIFDSGDLLDRILTTHFPSNYDDARSDNKSAEPEGVTIASLGGRTYAFIGLERSHSVLVFDVTDPANVTFTTFAGRVGDLNPEGMLVVPATDSPTGNPLLLVANEVSFTLTTYELLPQTPAMQLQILHYYGESGLLGIETAKYMGALIDKFDNDYSTVVIGEGDSYIPGPWLVGGADPALNRILHTGTFTSAADTTATPFAQADVAIMNAFGTTVSALGNHEFDLGSPVLAAAIAPAASSTVGNWAGADFPILTSNLNFAADSSLRAFADSTLGGSGGPNPPAPPPAAFPAPNAFRGAETSAIKAKIAPYAIKTINGQKVGFVGATTFDLLTKSSPNGTVPKDDANSATDDLQEVAAYVQAAVDSLKAIGVNKIIMVDQLDTLQRNKDLAPLLTGVDVMVAGGGHERMGDATDTAIGFNGHDANFIGDAYPIVTAGSDGKPTLIVTTDTEYSYLGRLVVDFDTNGELILGNLSPAINGAYPSTPTAVEAAYNNGQTAPQIVAASTIATKVKTITDAINTVVVAKDSNIYGYTDVYMEGDRVFGRTQEVNLGDITADANAWKAKQALGLLPTSAVFSLKNGGGIRASLGSVAPNGSKVPPLANPLTGKPSGAISQLDVENALRFDNRLMVFDTTPVGLLGILNYAAGLSSGPSSQSGGYPQVGNIRFSYEFSRPAGQKVRSVSLVNDYGAIVAKIVENGVVLATAPAAINVIALNFTANGGDGYPIKYLDPLATPPNQIPNPATSNFRFLLNNNTLSAAVPITSDFTAAAVVPANSLGEQKAFSDYLAAFHPAPAQAYNQADTPVALDTRIQQLPARASDTVLFGPIEYWRQAFFGNPNGTGPNEGNLQHADSDGVINLLEFAFGTDPLSNASGPNELTYGGTFSAPGSVLNGQPITAVQPIPNSVDFRMVFIRRTDYLAAGLTYTPQFSVAMTSWQNSSVTPTILADDGTYQMVSVPYPRFIGGKKARFSRVSVSILP